MSDEPLPRKSRIDAFAHVVGVQPDRDVAAAAGISTEAVRSWRIRRGIPARWRGETAEELAARSKAPSARTGRPAPPQPRKPRASQLDPFRAELGHQPDREVAEKAGVSPENVRSYRKRHGIPAFWRGEGKAPSSAAAGAPGAAPAAPPVGARTAFAVSVQVEAELLEYVVLAADIVGAARDASQRISTLHPGGRLRSIGEVGEALS